MSDTSGLNMLASIALADAVEEESKKVKYRECLRNHAANMGGHVTDGCGGFMPAGDESTPEALRCAACDCHRNFHRREVEAKTVPLCCHCGGVAAPPNVPRLPFARPQKLMAFNKGRRAAEVDAEREGSHGNITVTKRFRTQFSLEQKERMLGFAQKLGWSIRKHDEADVHNFCQEVGVQRQVLKDWMHNNKPTRASKCGNTSSDTPNNNASTSTTTNANNNCW